ncbi:hypothetical protein [Candidatus Anaplasma sp. TIGMIC]|uniref:hypothetical protein n=1 Tax=Candidatus Anaplasma sp. TIGMIC TaxID=3020713 RepID=UPI00232BBB28|nr:hypothetical protein [Candidatus Anaplasma sp. TIGMIC]
MRQSVFCGVAGSAKSVIALSSYIQAAVFIRLYRKNMDFAAAERQHYVKVAALKSMKQGILPSIEMFILMPVMFAGLHLYAHMPILACIAICWATMFSVCLFVRLTKIISKCPTIEHPMYSRGYPFPVMEGGRLAEDGVRDATFSHEVSSPKTPSLWKAYGVSLLFVIPRFLTLVCSLVLLLIETLCLVPIFIRDTFSALGNVWKMSKQKKGCISCELSFSYSDTADQIDDLFSLVLACATDTLWVATLGLSGMRSLHATATKNFDEFPPRASLTGILALTSAKTPQGDLPGASVVSARAS